MRYAPRTQGNRGRGWGRLRGDMLRPVDVPPRVTGAEVKAWRQVMGWSLRQADKYLGIDRERISSWERGKHSVPRWAAWVFIECGAAMGKPIVEALEPAVELDEPTIDYLDEEGEG